MAASRLKPASVDWRSVVLTPEEGFVLSRFDGPIDPGQVAALTGLPEDRVEAILRRLIEVGVLVFEAAAAAGVLPSIPPPAATSRPPPSALDPLAEPLSTGAVATGARSLPGTEGLASAPPRPNSSGVPKFSVAARGGDSGRPSASAAELPEGLLPSLTGVSLIPPSVPSLFASTAPARVATDDVGEASLPGGAAWDMDAGLPEETALDVDVGSVPVISGDEAALFGGGRGGEDEAAVAEDEDSTGGAASASGPPLAPHGDDLAAYAARFRQLAVTERIELGRTAGEPELAILCLDPDPQVVVAVLSNPGCGLRHARRLALHHRSPVGLEQLSRHAELVRDAQVQRNLLRNPQLSDAILQRLAARKQLSDLYKLCLDRDLPEQSRLKLRALLRSRFGNASPDEKVDLVFRTEGRVLTALVGCTFDAKSAALMVQRTVTSLVLVQNLARFSATPPAVLAKLVQLPMVVRQPGIRQLLLRHPNLPGEAKRRG